MRAEGERIDSDKTGRTIQINLANSSLPELSQYAVNQAVDTNLLLLFFVVQAIQHP